MTKMIVLKKVRQCYYIINQNVKSNRSCENVIVSCLLHTEDKEIRAEKENGINISMTSQCEQNKPASDDPLDQVFIAFARVFSGTVKKGQKLYVLGPKHDPAKALQKVGLCL